MPYRPAMFAALLEWHTRARKALSSHVSTNRAMADSPHEQREQEHPPTQRGADLSALLCEAAEVIAGGVERRPYQDATRSPTTIIPFTHHRQRESPSDPHVVHTFTVQILWLIIEVFLFRIVCILSRNLRPCCKRINNGHSSWGSYQKEKRKKEKERLFGGMEKGK